MNEVTDLDMLRDAINYGLPRDMAVDLAKQFYRKHPAKYSPEIMDVIAKWCYRNLPERSSVLDPFAGVGRIHQLSGEDALAAPQETYAIELEPEWAIQSAVEGDTWCGDMFDFASRDIDDRPWRFLFDAIITSPTYGNRMADNHNAMERCKACTGSGHVTPKRAVEIDQEWNEDDEHAPDFNTCVKCEGRGRRNYERMTYTHKLGRKLTSGNSGQMRWGMEYKSFHRRAWRACTRLLEPRGWLIINVKNHVRLHEEVDVVAWHRDFLMQSGFELYEDIEVQVHNYGNGQNAKSRAECEHVLVFRRKA